MTLALVVQLVLRILLAATFVFMGVSHFLPRVRRGMRAMIPPALRQPGMPSPALLVTFTGVAELAGAVGLVTPWPLLRQLTGIALVVFLVLVFPANAYASQHREKFGRTAVPFWPRYVGQLGLIALALAATVPFN
ncbi:MAG TPA: DoxX family protein [Pseudolysinimonas sp.]